MNYTFLGILLGAAVSVCYCKITDTELNNNELNINSKIFLILTGSIIGPIIGTLCPK